MASHVEGSEARPGARPVPGRRPPGALAGARLAARMAPSSTRTIADVPRTGTVEELCAHKRTLLATFRRSGVVVATPVWAAEAGGRFYVRSERTAGKIKRLRNDPRVLVAPCTVRGKPLGAPLEATASVVPPEREDAAEQALVRRYGPGRALFEWTFDRMRIDMCYLEIVPGGWDVR
jgi:PPOX class probable F420-dependent enzyme